MTTNTKYRQASKARIRTHLARVPFEIQCELEPKAPVPPHLVPLADDDQGGRVAVWRDTCKGAVDYRCGNCALCEWEKKANRWAAVAPWYQPPKLAKPAGAPKWSNIHVALRALAELELYGRTAKSAVGEILENARRGAIRWRKKGTTYRRNREDRTMAQAVEAAQVDRAVTSACEREYDYGAPNTEISRVRFPNWTLKGTEIRNGLKLTEKEKNVVALIEQMVALWPEREEGIPTPEIKALLLACTDGVLERVPTFPDLESAMEMPAGLCREIVRYTRKHATIELAARGLIPMPDLKTGYRDAISLYRQERGWE